MQINFNNISENAIDLKQIYVYYLRHPLCKFTQILYPDFVACYTQWINKN